MNVALIKNRAIKEVYIRKPGRFLSENNKIYLLQSFIFYQIQYSKYKCFHGSASHD